MGGAGTQHRTDESVEVQAGRNATSIHRVDEQKKEVVHIGKDVTIIYFPSKPAPDPAPVGQVHVVHIGEDVTMRLFASTRRDNKRLEPSRLDPKRVSDRSVSRGSADAPSEPVATGAKSRN